MASPLSSLPSYLHHSSSPFHYLYISLIIFSFFHYHFSVFSHYFPPVLSSLLSMFISHFSHSSFTSPSPSLRFIFNLGHPSFLHTFFFLSSPLSKHLPLSFILPPAPHSHSSLHLSPSLPPAFFYPSLSLCRPCLAFPVITPLQLAATCSASTRSEVPSRLAHQNAAANPV